LEVTKAEWLAGFQEFSSHLLGYFGIFSIHSPLISFADRNRSSTGIFEQSNSTNVKSMTRTICVQSATPLEVAWKIDNGDIGGSVLEIIHPSHCLLERMKSEDPIFISQRQRRTASSEQKQSFGG
jgi:hypothetical protein